ncbi:hypothetical protein BCR44DRAFT_134710 [Catenaria anguillulae PL171]|uniref:Nucleotide-diphospho-sugar transferase domain-containing protein n=1 Tax=Catenaria anguillulae PL171 TaxID=765915 RepID=A0A1Y2HEW1_9FUNG|nr:hypothetical protein BCR44DRAFT_134710 [Catenaria anguillulae PL171]
MYKLFNADELGLDWEWDWRQEQPGAIVNGKKQRVVVMHADTRPLQDLEQVGNDPFNFKHMTMGPLYVMWWAMRHGYDYRRVRLNQPGVKYGGWGKPKVIYDALHRYDWVVFVDSDAYPRRPDLSLEDLLDRWGFHANASVMLPLDPPEQLPENRNATNNGPALNTGFWIAHSTPTAKAILRDLTTCLDRDNCKRWRTDWPAEQAAFSKVVVPNYVQGRDIINAPCGEANGWWAVSICPGALWTHTWTGKEWAPKNMIERFMIEQIKVWQRLMKASYHSSDECTFWKTGEDERCTFKEDLDSIDGRSTDLMP